ncbi:MAG: 2-hydroxy-acid oxidase, partial [Rhodospirillales bacterium]|nr:2-hydroxy-acid oxidase [Rhodospirillales bacterium]
GLVWISAPASNDGAPPPPRADGGHATLMRAPASVRGGVAVFEELPAGVAALSARIKESFDPERVLNPGRMYPGI